LNKYKQKHKGDHINNTACYVLFPKSSLTLVNTA
jgi:hypothetical protein